MMKRWGRTRVVPTGLAVAVVALSTFAAPPAAMADATRTLNLSYTCATGEPYGLLVNTGSGYYSPSGSSYVVGNVKNFTVTIPASATTLQYMPLSCDNQPASNSGSTTWWRPPYNLTPGTSTINANGSCQDYSYNYGWGSTILIFDCSISSLTYS